MVRLTDAALERLRDRLRSRGERPSLILPNLANTSAAVLEAVQIVTEYGALCEAMFLVMLADGRVKNVERDVLRGALRILSNDHVRSSHIESMLDSAARNVAEQGVKARLDEVIVRLRDDRARAEIVYVLAAAIAAADQTIVPAEEEILAALGEGLGINEHRANELLHELTQAPT